MNETIGIFVAWPYANGDFHVGHIAGAYLPADIFARYHRLRGNRVLMVSGSDSHGTPITVRADEEGTTPEAVFLRFHNRFLESLTRLGISFDLFTHTDTENHHRVSQDIFLKLYDAGYLYREIQHQLYSVTENRFLPDRYVEGTCPICGYSRARGDQCEHCGNLLDATQLIDPRSKTDGSKPVVRETEHFFLDLPRLSQRLADWLAEGKDDWRPNVINFTRNYVAQGLQGRPITRDIEWGIPVPLPGYEHKRIYVWFEAVIGYFSASIEWAQDTGQPEAWKAWWYDPAAKGYYFIGKDNIPFHTIIWPAMLVGTGRLYEDDPSKRLNLPYDVPANEFMNLEGEKLSTSRNWAVWVPDFLSRYAPDPLRYYLTVNAPEGRDTDFAWAGFLRRNNDELVATWGNLVHRAMTFAYRNFDGRVPEPGSLSDADVAILDKMAAGFGPIGGLLAGCKFKQALTEAMLLAQEGNRYFNDKAPWQAIKTDRQAAATTLFVALRVIDSLKTLLFPFLPFTGQRLHEYLGYTDDLLGRQETRTFGESIRSHTALVYSGEASQDRWRPSELPPGQPLQPPQPLFEKLDEAIVEQERARLGQPG
jgi:methionyl-tRNA synthetase